MMSPPPHVVRRLHAYDPELRCRWGKHAKLWLIEKRMPERSRQWLSERPNPHGVDPARVDLAESWQQGYVLVMTVHPSLLGSPLMWETLRGADLQVQGSVDKMADWLDRQDAEQAAAVDAHIHDMNGELAKDVHDRIAWLDGRRVQMPGDPAPEPAFHVEQCDGFVVHDRRRASALVEADA